MSLNASETMWREFAAQDELSHHTLEAMARQKAHAEMIAVVVVGDGMARHTPTTPDLRYRGGS